MVAIFKFFGDVTNLIRIYDNEQINTTDSGGFYVTTIIYLKCILLIAHINKITCDDLVIS